MRKVLLLVALALVAAAAPVGAEAPVAMEAPVQAEIDPFPAAACVTATRVGINRTCVIVDPRP